MTTQGSFNREKFRKLVAMMDSPYREEAITAFRLALDELAKKQEKFTDQFIDTEDAAEAKAECENLRAELAEAFELHAKEQTKTADLEETIDRLHEHMAAMEQAQAENDKPVPESPDAADLPSPPDPPAPGPYQWPEETESSSDLSTDAASRSESSPSLPWTRVLFWLALPITVICYAVKSYSTGHLLTENEWRSFLPVFPVLVLLGMGFTFGVGRFWKFGGRPLHRWCVENLEAPRVMLWTLYGVLVAWVIFAYPLFDSAPPDDRIYLALFMLAASIGVFLVLRYTIRNFGWRGLFVKLALIFDGLFLGLVVVIRGNPFAFHSSFHSLTAAKPDHLLEGLAAYLLVVILAVSGKVTYWFLEVEERAKPVLGMAFLIIGISGAVLIDASHTAHAQEPRQALPQAPAPSKPHHTRKSPADTRSPGAKVADIVWRSSAPETSSPLLLQTAFTDPSSPWASEVQSPSSNDQSWGSIAFWVTGFFVVCMVLSHRSQKKKYLKALRGAYEPLPANEKGNAGHASIKDAKSKGWI